MRLHENYDLTLPDFKKKYMVIKKHSIYLTLIKYFSGEGDFIADGYTRIFILSSTHQLQSVCVFFNCFNNI